MEIAWGILLSMSLLAASGCTATIREAATKHIVMINGRGDPVDTNRSHNRFFRFFVDYEQFPSEEEYQNHFRNVIEAMDGSTREQYERGKKRKVLIFVHGGLNTQVSTIVRANDLYEPIEQAGSYPIFINWQSSLISSYRDHLLFVRQGKWRDWGPLLAPFYLVMDILRGIARLPVTWYFMFYNDAEGVWDFEDGAYAEEAFRNLSKEYRDGHPPAIAISQGKDLRTPPEKILSFLQYVATLPTKLLIAPFLDAIGTSAWDVMLRRTRAVYHKEGEFSTGASNIKPEQEGEGGLSTFMRQLRLKVNQNPHQWEITLVGHSMGAIIVNEMLRRFSDLDFSNIVYMGAACTIRDYEDSLFPYLLNQAERRRQGGDEISNAHTQTQVYHLVLHREAERRERWEKIPKVVDLPPRGSLLIWIDSFLSKPETALDRTLGRWTNLAVALRNTPLSLRGQIHVKAFSVGKPARNTNPQEHSDLAKFPFWERPYWEPQEHR